MWLGDAVKTEGSPVVAFEVPGHEAPTLADRYDVVRFDASFGDSTLGVAVVESGSYGVSTRAGQCRQYLEADVRDGPWRCFDAGGDCFDLGSCRGGQHVHDFGECADSCVADAIRGPIGGEGDWLQELYEAEWTRPSP